MRVIWPIIGIVSILSLTGCPGGGGGKAATPFPHPVTTTIPQDDVSDLNAMPDGHPLSESQITQLCSSTCALPNLVERDDLMNVNFDQLTRAARVFSFRHGWGKCAITLTGANGGVVKADTYNKWDPKQYAEPKNLHFTIGKSGQSGDYCVPNGSVWEKVDCSTHAPDQILRLRRVDKEVNETIWISTYRGWKGTLMARRSGILHPMVCQ